MTIEQLTTALTAAARALNPSVAYVEIETGLDSTNDKAVWVRVTFNDWPDFETRQHMRDVLGDQARELENVEYAYVRFQNAAQVLEAQGK